MLKRSFNFENERKLVLATFKCVEKEISLANLFGTGHYLSPEGEDFTGKHLTFRRTKGGISRN